MTWHDCKIYLPYKGKSIEHVLGVKRIFIRLYIYVRVQFGTKYRSALSALRIWNGELELDLVLRTYNVKEKGCLNNIFKINFKTTSIHLSRQTWLPYNVALAVHNKIIKINKY